MIRRRSGRCCCGAWSPAREGRSARFAGFADSLGTTVAELESALLEPGELDGELAELYGAYREELDRLGLWDRELERRYAAERAAGDLDAWEPRPVFAYGFEDLTGAEWALLEALAARAEVTVSLPVRARPRRLRLALAHRRRPSRARGRADRGAAAEPARHARPCSPTSSARSSRRARAGAELDGSLRFLEGAGIRGTLELVADEILALLRDGTPADEIAIVCPTLDRWRASLDTAFTTLGVPYALEGRLRLGQTPFGQALLSLLRYAWLDGQRRELFAFLRSPYSGLRAPPRRLPRGPAARPRRDPAGAGRGGGRRSSAASRCRTSTPSAARPTRWPRSPSSLNNRPMCAFTVGTDRCSRPAISALVETGADREGHLVLALGEPRQLPGRPGCGRVRLPR